MMKLGLALLISLLCLTPLFVDGASQVPTSSRSRKAMARVRPLLHVALQAKGLQFGSPVYIRIFKESSELEVWIKKDKQFRLFKTYAICTFSGELGPKLREGDLQSPEGFYFVSPRRMHPYSRFHLSFNLGYPNAYDSWHQRTGSALMVHGSCVSIGCYAMTDAGIEEIFALAEAALRNGQPFFRVHVFPFRMTATNLRRHANSKWKAFWDNLKEGHDFFERDKRPPNVKVKAGRYIFETSE